MAATVAIVVIILLLASSAIAAWLLLVKKTQPRVGGAAAVCGSHERQIGTTCYSCADGYTLSTDGSVCIKDTPCPTGMVDSGTSCTKLTYPITSTPLQACAGTESDIKGLCYSPCPAGYDITGSGLKCSKTCPSGYPASSDTACGKPTTYGRGAGYPWKFGDSLNDDGMFKRCLADNPQGCEKNGLIVYPKCKAGFHNEGCCLCVADCPAGFDDNLLTCKRPQTDRAVNPTPRCTNKEQRTTGCFDLCKDGYTSDGTSCWQSCPTGWTPGGKEEATKCVKANTTSQTSSPCPNGQSVEGGVCYASCPTGYVANGAICKQV